MSEPDVKRYSNGEVTVVWKPGVCMHSAVCFRGLPKVFDPSRRPWIAIDAAPTKAIVEQVRRCPSGALSILRPRRGRTTAPEKTP